MLWSAHRDRRLSLWLIDDACEGDTANYGGGASDGGSIFDSPDN